MSQKLPEQKGLRVIETKLVPLCAIHRINPDESNAFDKMKYLNVARPNGVDPDKVVKFVHIIRNGDYDNENNIPPVVVETEPREYRLVSGDHRYQGHMGADQESMFVVVAEFFETEGKSARYWMYTWQSNENDKDPKHVEKNYRDDDCVASTIVHLCSLDEVDPHNDDDLTRALVDQGYVKYSNKLNNMMFKVRKELGGHVNVPHVFDSEGANRYLRKRGLDSESNVVRMMKSSSGFDLDYDWRFLKDVVKKFQDGAKKVNGYLHFSGLSADKLMKCREVKSNRLLSDHYEHCKAFVDLYENGRLDRDYQQRYLCQFDAEEGSDYVE